MKQPDEAKTNPQAELGSEEEHDRRFADVARLLLENQGKISLSQYENTMQTLFERVEGLDSIQKNARLRVFRAHVQKRL